jgi:hypothetical protein
MKDPTPLETLERREVEGTPPSTAAEAAKAGTSEATAAARVSNDERRRPRRRRGIASSLSSSFSFNCELARAASPLFRLAGVADTPKVAPRPRRSIGQGVGRGEKKGKRGGVEEFFSSLKK